MRTTVTIDDDLYVKVKQIAAESGHTFGQIISELARKGLGAHLSRRSEAKAEAQCNPESVIPVFRVMIGAAIIPGNRAAAPA
ncbi:MAG: antitoxin [Verrucomicrobia bacterium]|nr:antitoxin [Verrucomicrobiota bacterium]